MRQNIVIACLCLLASAAANAADAPPPKNPNDPPGDADALSLADEAKSEKRAQRDWQAFGEAAISRTAQRNGQPTLDGRRLSLDLRWDGTLTPGLRAVLSDRLDLSHSSEAPRETNVNTLREAYLSWHASPDLIADIGRINLRYGAALGYNPTDFFKTGALRSIVSPDPNSLRENRQGSFVLQGQKLWSGGSLSAALSPEIGHAPSDATLSLDANATNPRDRWLLAASHKFSENFNPQLVLHGGAGMATQIGLNLSGLLGSSTTAFLELSSGKGKSLVAQAQGLPEAERVQRRATIGATYTTPFNLSLTAEAEHNSAAPNRAQWNAFIAAAPGNAQRLLGLSELQQDLPVRQALFLYAAWRDMGIRNLDFSAFIRRDGATRSRAQWLETRYRWGSAEVALQWQAFSGDPSSLYGAVPQPRRVELLLRYFL